VARPTAHPSWARSRAGEKYLANGVKRAAVQSRSASGAANQNYGAAYSTKTFRAMGSGRKESNI
jgi:hypothetical protein